LSIHDKPWDLTNPTSPITLDKAYQNVAITYVPSDLVLSEYAKVKTPFNPSSNTATAASIEIISEDTYTPKLYNITINRLATTAEITSATLSQTSVGSGVVDTTVTLQKTGTDLKVPVTHKFVSGAGQFRIKAIPVESGSIINANDAGYVFLLNTTSPSYNPAITVLSEDRRTKKEYNLIDVNYLNNGTKLKSIEFTYSHPIDHPVTGTVNASSTSQIDLSEKLIKNIGALTLVRIGGNATYDVQSGVSSSLGASATMNPQNIANALNCVDCLSVKSESTINTTSYTINYTYKSNEVGITNNDKDISFRQGTTVFSIDNGRLVYDGENQIYTLQRVSASAGDIMFNNLVMFAGNTARYSATAIEFNNLNNTVLASLNTATPTTSSLVLTAEDGTTKTYTFKIEIVCANPTLEDLRITGISAELNNLNLMSLAQNNNRNGSTNANNTVLLFRYDKDLPTDLSSMQIRYKGKNFETTDYAYSNLVNYSTAVFQFDIKCGNKKLYIRHVDLRLKELKHGVVNDDALRIAPLNITTTSGVEDFRPSIFTWNPAKGDYTVNYTLKYDRTGSEKISLPAQFAVSQNASASDITTTLKVSSFGFERQYNMANKLDVADKGRLAYTTYDRTKGTAGHNVPNKHWFKYGAITELTSRIPGNVSLVRYRDGSLNNESLKNLWSFDGDVYKVNADGTITRLKSRPESGTTHPWLLQGYGYSFMVYDRKYVALITANTSVGNTFGNPTCKKNTPNGTWHLIYLDGWFPTDWKSTTSVVGDPYIFQDYDGSGYRCLSAGYNYLRIPFCSSCPDTYIQLSQGYQIDNDVK
jgi:hypothetical protein